MPTRVQLPDGNTGEFPDGMSSEQIEAVLQKQFPRQTSVPANALKTEERTVGNYASEGVRGVGRGLADDAAGLYQSIRHPIDTAKAMKEQADRGANAAGQSWQDTAGQPLPQRVAASALSGMEEAPLIGPLVQRAEQGGTEMGSPEAFGAAAEGVSSFAVPELVGKGVGGLIKRTGKALTGTGTGPTEALVEKTKEANTRAAESAAEKNAAQQAKASDRAAAAGEQRKVDLRKHFDKTQEAKQANLEKEGQVSRREALQRGTEKLSDRFQEDLKSTRDKAAAAANAKYTALNEALGGKVIRSEHLLSHLLDASEKFKGSMTEPPIFKDIEKAVKSSDVISYDDLQGYYSELGRELQKGTLQGDVYTAYSTLQDAIGGEMQRVADQNGMGSQLTDARTSWRNLKQTFYDPKSPLRRALDSKEPGAAARSLAGKDRTGIEALAKYNPDLARSANTIRGYQSEAAALPKQVKGLKSLPKLPERPPAEPAPTPIEPARKTIGADDIQEAKRKGLQQTSDRIVRHGTWLVTWPLFYAMKDVLHGQMPSLPGMAAESAGTVAAVHGIASILKNPKVVEFLTKATPEDVNVIPPDLRGDIGGIVKEAQKGGIKVSPALLKGAAKRGTVAAALSGNRPRFDVETGTQPTNDTMPGGNGDLSALPGFLQRALAGAKVVEGSPTSTYGGKQDIATVDEGDSKTITVRDPSRLEPQVLAHESKHLFDRNLAPEVRAQFPKDDPNNPYMKPEDLLNLPDMRKRGMTAKSLPEEKQAQLVQAYVQYPQMRQMLQPWMDDMEAMRQSNILPTDAGQQGINTTPRAPAPPEYAYGTGRNVGTLLARR